MKWISVAIVGFILGLAIAVFTWYILFFFPPVYDVLVYLCNCSPDQGLIVGFFTLGVALITGVAGWAVAVWQLGKRGIGKGTYILTAILLIALIVVFIYFFKNPL